MNRDRIVRALFWVGAILVPAAILLGLYGHLITPPAEGELQWKHIQEYYGYPYNEYYDETGRFDHDHWHRDYVFGNNIQILAAFLLVAGGILAFVTYQDDRKRAAAQVTEEEIRSWSLPPPVPRRQKRRWKLPIVSRRLKVTAVAAVVALVVGLVVVLPILKEIAAGPEHSGVISVTVDDNVYYFWEGSFYIYVGEEEVAAGVPGFTPSGGGHSTVNITVTWHGNLYHQFDVSIWYDGRLRTSSVWVSDQNTTLVRFDVGQY